MDNNRSTTQPAWMQTTVSSETTMLIDQIRSRGGEVVPAIAWNNFPPVAVPFRKETHRWMVTIRQQCHLDRIDTNESSL